MDLQPTNLECSLAGFRGQDEVVQSLHKVNSPSLHLDYVRSIHATYLPNHAVNPMWSVQLHAIAGIFQFY